MRPALFALTLGFLAEARADPGVDAQIDKLVARALAEFHDTKLFAPPGDNVDETLKQLRPLLMDRASPDARARVEQMFNTIAGPPARSASPGTAQPTPAPPTGQQLAPPPVMAPVVASPPRPEPEGVAPFLSRGAAALDLGQIAQARDWYRFAAEKGSAEAARRLAETYDTAFLDKRGALGIRGDPEQAKRWLDRAHELEAIKQ